MLAGECPETSPTEEELLTYKKFVELYMPMEDAPKALKLVTQAAAENNAKQ